MVTARPFTLRLLHVEIPTGNGSFCAATADDIIIRRIISGIPVVRACVRVVVDGGPAAECTMIRSVPERAQITDITDNISYDHIMIVWNARCARNEYVEKIRFVKSVGFRNPLQTYLNVTSERSATADHITRIFFFFFSSPTTVDTSRRSDVSCSLHECVCAHRSVTYFGTFFAKRVDNNVPSPVGPYFTPIVSNVQCTSGSQPFRDPL
jgi:hypothetical protein